MSATISRICRYPVKSLNAEELTEVTVQPDRTLPGDRRFAIARGSRQVETHPESWVSYDNFVTLRRSERLAQLQVSFDAESGQMALRRKGRTVAQGKVTEPLGRTIVDQFLAAFLKDDLQGAPKLVDARDIALTDSDDPEISFINLASVRDLERVVGQPVDPLRFRGNFYIDGLPAWAEMDWVGRRFQAGAATFEVTEPIERCAATTVNPDTAQRDINIPKLLQRGYNHICMGVYAICRAGGTIRQGDTLQPPD